MIYCKLQKLSSISEKELFYMQRIIHYTVKAQDSGLSILAFLRKNGFSKHILTTMKRAEHAILLNGLPAFGRTILKEQDVLKILVPEEVGPEESIIPVKSLWISCTKMRISWFLTNRQICLFTLLPEIMRTLWQTELPGIINSRGKLLFTAASTAWTATPQEFLYGKKSSQRCPLSAQMKQRQIRRTYLALTDGIPPKKGLFPHRSPEWMIP